MNRYRIRFNKSRGQAGRGSVDHVWRVFENEKEYLFKHLDIRVPVRSEKEEASQDWNIVCNGMLTVDRDTSTAIIANKPVKLKSTAKCTSGANTQHYGFEVTQ